MGREQFTFYRSYYDAIKHLPKEQQGLVAMAIIAYALDDVEPVLEGENQDLPDPASGYFILIRPTLDASRKKSEIALVREQEKKAKREAAKRTATRRKTTD